MAGKIKSLGEIALRVSNLDAMVEFYESVVQLPLLRRSDKFAFFRIAEGHEGHTQVLALFDRRGNDGYIAPAPSTTTVDHLAFNISLSDFGSEKERLERLGISVTVADHGWVQWRSLYLVDPEGNTVEFVCFDEAIKKEYPND